MRVFGSANNVTTSSSTAPHTSDVEADEQGEEDTAEVPVDEGFHGKNASVLSFDSRKYEREET